MASRPAQGLAQIGVRLGDIGPDAKRARVTGNRGIESFQPRIGVAKHIVKKGHIRIARGQRRAAFQNPLQIALLVKRA